MFFRLALREKAVYFRRGKGKEGGAMKKSRCKRCGKEKTIAKGRPWCIECYKEYSREYYRKHKERHRVLVLRWLINHPNYHLVKSVDKKRGCSICGDGSYDGLCTRCRNAVFTLGPYLSKALPFLQETREAARKELGDGE
jgi:hypothetical protein